MAERYRGENKQTNKKTYCKSSFSNSKKAQKIKLL